MLTNDIMFINIYLLYRCIYIYICGKFYPFVSDILFFYRRNRKPNGNKRVRERNIYLGQISKCLISIFYTIWLLSGNVVMWVRCVFVHILLLCIAMRFGVCFYLRRVVSCSWNRLLSFLSDARKTTLLSLPLRSLCVWCVKVGSFCVVYSNNI